MTIQIFNTVKNLWHKKQTKKHKKRVKTREKNHSRRELTTEGCPSPYPLHIPYPLHTQTHAHTMIMMNAILKAFKS